MDDVIKVTAPEIQDRVEREIEGWGAGSSKAAQRARDETFSAWLKEQARRKREGAAEAAKVALEMDRQREEEAKRAHQVEVEFRKWVAKKEVERAATKEAAYVNSSQRSEFGLSSVRNSVEKHCREDKLFTLVDALVCECEGIGRLGKGCVDPATVMIEMIQASVQRKVTEKMIVLEQRAQNDTRTKDEQKSDRLKNKHGQQILSLISSGRQLFGASIQSVRDVFHAADRNSNGKIDKDEFKAVCDRLDLGFGTPQLQELWSCFDIDGSGDLTYQEFEDLLIETEAQKQLSTVSKAAPNRQILAQELRATLGESSSKKLIEKIFRSLSAREDSGATPPTVGLWDLRTALRKVEYVGLSPGQRNNLMKTFEALFRKLDTDKLEKIFLGDFEFFIRKLLIQLAELATCGDDDGDPSAQTRDAILHRIGRVMLNNIKQSVSPADRRSSIVPATLHAFKAFEGANSEFIGRVQFQHVLRSMGFGLSLSQELLVVDAIDTDKNGTIEKREFVHFISTVEGKVAAEAQAKAERSDPRNNGLLIDIILKNVTGSYELLAPILKGARTALQEIAQQGSFDDDE
jgi:Ca2+-binding EF-hand superfamily protein